MIWLALLAGHLLSDFVFQSGFVEERKGVHLARHMLVVALTTGATLLLLERWAPTGLGPCWVLVVAAVVGLVHGAQDVVVAKTQPKNLIRLGIDQLVHLVVLWGMATALASFPGIGAVPVARVVGSITPGAINRISDAMLGELAEIPEGSSPTAGLTTGVMSPTTGGGTSSAASGATSDVTADATEVWVFGALAGIILLALGTAVTAVLIAHLLEPYRVAMTRDSEGGVAHDADLLPKAGLWIGLCERFLLILAIAVGTEVVPAVGLLMGVKSIYRFRDLDKRTRAEYYLLGTLLSVTAAVVVGIALRWVVSNTALPL